MTYNGWSNYETWAVNLWLTNDGFDAVKFMDNLRPFDAYQLGKAIQEYVEDSNPLSEQASLYSDLLNTALHEVDWFEVAEHLMPEGME